jgi:hypothetical protein
VSETTPELSHLLERSAQELRRCRAVVVQLEDAVHALIDAGNLSASSGPLADLQAIDLLDQRLEDLALWLEALSAAAGPCRADRPARDLAAPLRLEEMRRSLAGSAASGPSAAAAPPGQAEVF